MVNEYAHTKIANFVIFVLKNKYSAKSVIMKLSIRTTIYVFWQTRLPRNNIRCQEQKLQKI